MSKSLLFLLLFSIMGAVSLNAQPEVVVTTDEWVPYTSPSPDDPGFFTAIVSAVFEKMGVKAVYQFSPWIRAEAMVRDGLAFACMPYLATDERRRTFDFSDAVAETNGRFFLRVDGKIPQGFDWKSLEDLKPFVVGGVKGYWYESAFAAAGLDVDYTFDDVSNFRKLASRRVDLLPVDEAVGHRLIQTLFPGHEAEFRTLTRTLNTTVLRLMVSRTYPHADFLLKKFNLALADFKKTSGYETILKRYALRP